jgi:radical SAM protein with 4Fe4S-binding SPASM domain
MENEVQPKHDITLYYDWPAAFMSIQGLLKKGVSTCGIFRILGVLSDGSYAMCGIGVNIPELVYGEIGRDILEEVWVKNATLVRLRQEVPTQLEGICGKCILKNSCLASCVAHNYFESGRLTGSHWFCQQAYENGLFPLTRIINEREKQS